MGRQEDRSAVEGEPSPPETQRESGRDARRRRVTIVDVARHAGVSKSTVSLVVSGSPLAAEETRERVLKSMAALGYIYHRGAATLRGARSSLIGMVINDLSNPFFHELAIGIERACQSGAYVPLIANTSESPTRQSDVIRSMREHGAVGLIVCPAHGSSAAELNALTAGIPVVLTIRRLPGVRASVLAPDNRPGARQAVAHLIALGHRRIAFIGGLASVVRDERLGGYRDALAEAGIEADPALICETAPTRAGGHAAVAPLLAMRDPPTAALCFNDIVAIGAMYALPALGRTVGRDFAVIGFDDIDEAKHIHPPLSTVAVDSRGMGERAAHLLMRQLAAGQISHETQATPTQLIIRATCGTPGAAQGGEP